MIECFHFEYARYDYQFQARCFPPPFSCLSLVVIGFSLADLTLCFILVNQPDWIVMFRSIDCKGFI